MGIAMNGIYELSVYLPNSADWYFFGNRELMPTSDSVQTLYLGDL